MTKNETIHYNQAKAFEDQPRRSLQPADARNAIEIVIHSGNPLDAQLTRITGDGWNTLDWTNTLGTNVIMHRKTDTTVYVHSRCC